MATRVSTGEITLDDALRYAIDGMFIIDRNRGVVFFSEGCERITGMNRASIVPSECPCHQLLECRDEHDRALAGALCPSVGIFNGERTAARQRMSIRHRDGRRIWVETAYSPMFDDSGRVNCVVGIMRDMTEAREREEQLRALAGQNMASDNENMSTPTDSCCGVPAEGDQSAVSTDSSMGPLDQMLTSIEKREILAALRRANGQRTLAARMLGISRSRLYRRMEALGIDPREIGAQ
jgi:PAS domain S-box-containing protein